MLTRWKLKFFILVSLSAFVAGTTSASADSVVDADSTSAAGVSSSAILGATARESDTVTRAQANAQAAAAPNPYGCVGKTDYPHVSASYASVHGRTTCTSNVGYLSVTTTLLRDRWFGQESLASSRSYRNFARSSQDAAPHWNCLGSGQYTYWGKSSHEMTDGTNNYYAYTSQYYRLFC